MSAHPLATRLRGLYAIADHTMADDNAGLHEKVARAITGGARLVQIRDKRSQPDVEEISAIAKLCRQQQVPLLINDNIELALEVGANGVHLGQTDTGLDEARRRLGQNAIIGITCHDRMDLALKAQAGGADYVAFGRFFPSRTKPEAPAADIEVLSQARAALNIPIVAIGGITPDNGASLIRAGADMLAVIHGVFGQADIEAAASAVSKLFEPQE